MQVGLELSIALEAGAVALEHEAERMAAAGLRMSAMELAHYAAVLRGARLEEGTNGGLREDST